LSKKKTTTDPADPAATAPEGAPSAADVLPPTDPALERDLLSEFGQLGGGGGEGRDPDDVLPPEGEGGAYSSGIGADLFNADLLAQLVEMYTDYRAARLGDHWKLTAGEKDNFGKLAKRFLDKRASFLAGMQEDLAFAVGCLAIFGPRFAIDARNAADGGGLGGA
jgi:hypothetical protein